MACSRLKNPSLLTSKTKSNSRGSLSGRAWLRSIPAACNSTSMRPERRPNFVDDLGDRLWIDEVDAEIIGRATAHANRLDSNLGSLRPLQNREFPFDQSRSSSFSPSLNARGTNRV